MGSTARSIALAAATLFAMTGFVLALTVALLSPPAADLVALAIFLSVSGGATSLLGLAATRLVLPRWAISLRARLVVVSVLTATLALANVAVTASPPTTWHCWPGYLASQSESRSSSHLPFRSRQPGPFETWPGRPGE